jgi:hypothetical protein
MSRCCEARKLREPRRNNTMIPISWHSLGKESHLFRWPLHLWSVPNEQNSATKFPYGPGSQSFLTCNLLNLFFHIFGLEALLVVAEQKRLCTEVNDVS